MNKYVSPKWPGKLFPKIDIFVDDKYAGSSNAYATLKNAVAGYREEHPEASNVEAIFDKDRR